MSKIDELKAEAEKFDVKSVLEKFKSLDVKELADEEVNEAYEFFRKIFEERNPAPAAGE